MKKIYSKISCIVPATMMFLFALMSWAQTPVVKGKGSYASTIPSDQDAAVITAMNSFSALQLTDGITKPMPTNDWWTAVTNTQYGGQLWANPCMIVPKNFGFILYYPKNFDQGDMKVENPINIKGWAPAKTKAKDWSDWMVTVNMEETAAKTMDITMAHGIPYVYTQFKGFNMQIEFPTSATFPAPTFFKLDGTVTAFPYTADILGFSYMNATYSVCVPANSQFTVATTTTTTTVTITQTNSAQQYAVFGLLPQKTDIATFYKYGYSLPTATTLTYDYTPAQAKVTSKWTVTTTNLKGGTELGTIQGFAPHHYKYSTFSFPFTALEYRQHFGKIKCATGNVFDFSHDFNGCLAQMPVPVTTGVPYDYSTVKMKKLIDDYIVTYNTFGNDTYAGAKDMQNCVKYAYMAKLTNHPSYSVLLERSKKIMSDWMTYTPGEQQHYFARFGNWPSMLGLNSSYYSYNHTDNHFHYGYFTYSMALMGMMDPAYLQDYKEMIVLVAKQYANWDKTDTNFPWFRTFDPWTGHSWAGGRSGGTGNNQESTSEATQSWAGVFFLGNLLNDPNMQAAGAFGYMSESRATLEYWFDWDQSNWDPSYPGLSVGILYSGGLANNTHFSGTDPKAMYGINWLHPGPYLSYFTKNKTASNRDWNKLITAIGANPNNPGDFTGSGTGWQNVFYSYKAMLDPSYVCRIYDSLYNANAPMLKDELGGYIYYNAHSGLAMGDVQWNYYMTMPISQTYYNATTKQYTYVAYNPSSQEQVCTIYKDGGTLVGSFKVPAYTLIATHLDAVLTSIGITAGGNTVPVGSTLQLQAVGLDQYGATINLSGPVTWTTNGGGTINNAGLFTATTNAYPVTITAKSGTLTATYQIRVDELARLSKIVVSPDVIKIPQGSTYAFTAIGYDQYGVDMKIGNFAWSLTNGGGTIDNQGVFSAGTTTGAYEIKCISANIIGSGIVIIHPPLVNLALNKPISSSSPGTGTKAIKNANDGSLATRWQAADGLDNQWVIVDLQNTYNISQVILSWQNAGAKVYSIQVSDDGNKWKSIDSVSDGVGGEVRTLNVSGTGRYIRVFNYVRNTQYGFSLLELEVYGFAVLTGVTPSKIIVTPSYAQIDIHDKQQFTAYAYDANWNTIVLSGSWSLPGGVGTLSASGLYTPSVIGGPYAIRYTQSGISGNAALYVVNSTTIVTNGPQIATIAITGISGTTATSGGNITSDGGVAITARGICWSLVQAPTIANSKTTDGAGMGTYTSALTGLSPGTTYYVRAYATNSNGTTTYGNEISFTTSVTTGITSSSVSDVLSIYPNPASGSVNLVIASTNSSLVELKIVSVNGIVVYTKALTGSDYTDIIEMAAYGKGMYCVQLVTEKELFIQKLIVE